MFPTAPVRSKEPQCRMSEVVDFFQLPRDYMVNDHGNGKKSDSQDSHHDSSTELGHFERQAEFRFHPTPADRAEGIHAAGENKFNDSWIFMDG